MPLIIDPGLYLTTKSDVFWVNPKRALPTAFRLFTGLFSPSQLYFYVLVIIDQLITFLKVHVCKFGEELSNKTKPVICCRQYILFIDKITLVLISQ